MQIGFNLPMSGPLSAPDTLVRLALAGEAAGYDYVAVSDHVVEPIDIRARYPYSDTGEFPRGGKGERHEQLTAIAYLAGKTSRMGFLTSVMVVPHRPAVLTAKILSTIDVLSGGRLLVGIGAGWLKEEFDSLSVPDFAERGAVTDEYMQAFRELWTSEVPHFDGRFVKFSNVIFAPKPVQQPHPPLWVGGESGPALRRAARLGDGWYPIGTNPSHPLNTLARYRAGVARLRGMIESAGRDPAEVTLAYRVHRHGPHVTATADDGDRFLFSGELGDVIGDVQAMREIGVQALDFNFPGASAEAVIDALRQFQEDVVSKAVR